MMDKNEFKKKLLYTKIFEEEKNNFYISTEDLKNKYYKLGIDCTSLYRDITNYRIKKYGNSFFDKEINLDKYECKKRAATMRNINQYRRNRYGIKKNH